MPDIAPELVRRTRQTVDVDDLAATFVENEIGPFDWKKNWDQAKSRGNMQQRMINWLIAMNVDATPDEVIAAIDRLEGRWRT
jgi:hypothetical protein